MDGYESPSERFRNHNIREGLRYRIFVVKRQYHPFAEATCLMCMCGKSVIRKPLHVNCWFTKRISL